LNDDIGKWQLRGTFGAENGCSMPDPSSKNEKGY